MIASYGAYQEGFEKLTGLTAEEEVLKGLSSLVKKTVRAQWTVVYFRNKDRQGFGPARTSGLPLRYLHLFQQLPLPPEKIPLMKTLLKRKKHLLFQDPADLELIPPKLGTLLARHILLAVPMMVRNQVAGVVFVARAAGEPAFSHEEIQLVRSMASHAGLVTSHIRLFDDTLEMAEAMARHSDVISTLDEINKAISSSLSRDKIVETAVDRIGWIIQCDFMAVLVKGPEDLVVQVARSRGLNVPAPFTPGGHITGRNLAHGAFSDGQSRHLPLLSGSKNLGVADRILREAGLESLLAVPLTSKEDSKGVLLLGRTLPGMFSMEDTFAMEKVAAQMAVALENARLYDEMRDLFIATIATLSNAMDAKSPWTKGHSERVMHLGVGIAREMGLDEDLVERVRLGGLLHDIGKIGVIESLLDKPERLSSEEASPMRLHPEMGVEILRPIEKLSAVLPGILHHHERFDGDGYPAGLRGEEIPLEARIITVADSFDAIVSTRPYKKAVTATEALEELFRHAGKQFDPVAVQALARYLRREGRGAERKERPALSVGQSPHRAQAGRRL
ncbi:HD domain-containing phosphohydrolase [Geomesophilobacter sediminis]|uniref:HD domain-containing protein n=1 Tax=Geomesophilobacter sediminis TaxID=2798584 RepID=A0A8J7JBC4_9BACT|nr:HD domain-containing phosphohydrolase [Geomesophilobacter sediminis]MBJ6724416.1 HD domain-containing protein [Geomesophilobacter sediminis]